MAAPPIVLKTTPPKANRAVLARDRLARLWAEVNDRTAIVVCAPPGFGKTTLLGQWRRAWLERGAFVGWVTLDARDEPARFVEALLYALRVATGRTGFDAVARQYGGQPDRALDALTALMAEVATLATPTVLVLDEAERLPDLTAREALAYLLHNAPPNLHVLVGTRTPLPFSLADLAARGGATTLSAKELRLDLDETIGILARRFGPSLGIDDCARLHELTEGWPIGLQLAAASIERERDLHAAVESISARRGDLERYFFESLFARLPADLADFVTRVAILDALLPELCAAVTGHASAEREIERLTRETPFVIAAEGQRWAHLHPLARDFLLGRFERLDAGEQRTLHTRAAEWLAEHGAYLEAARHAAAAGDEPLAQTYAARCLFAIVKEGKLAEAREWLERLPEKMIAADVQLRLTAGWTMSLGDRPRDALLLVERIAREPGAGEAIRCEAALIGTCAAAFLDEPGTMARMQQPWRLPLPLDDPTFSIAFGNNAALMALFEGNSAPARQFDADPPLVAEGGPAQIALALRRMVAGLAHLWEGNAIRAETTLRSALDRTEPDAGRRSVGAAMFAAGLSAALLERDQLAAAEALLANRLDVIERIGLPDASLLAHRTLAYIARDRGDERRALEVLRNLDAQGEARRMPRLRLASLVEQVRIHALRARHETARELVAAVDALAPVFQHDALAPFEPLYRLQAAIAQAYVALAQFDWERAGADLERAAALAARLHRGRDALVVKVLRAVAAHQRGADGARELLVEAAELAAIGGLDRLLADTHPIAAEIGAARAKSPADRPQTMNVLPPAPPPVATTGGILTPKEAKVLQLLTAGMPNKLIAKALDVSDETVKWHLRNLFAKLNAGTRRHAVDRARLLGLVAN